MWQPAMMPRDRGAGQSSAGDGGRGSVASNSEMKCDDEPKGGQVLLACALGMRPSRYFHMQLVPASAGADGVFFSWKTVNASLPPASV